MSLYEAEEPLVPMANAPTPPRSWQAMLVTWWVLLAAGQEVTGLGRIKEVSLFANGEVSLSHQVWHEMWSLPPCSEARKAAFTLGAAAWLIERWRVACSEPYEDRAYPAPLTRAALHRAVGQLAESFLRKAAWHIDDARGEAHARTLGHEPTIPPHERIYCAGGPLEPDHGRISFITLAGRERGDVARRILSDHFERPRPSVKTAGAWMLGDHFEKLAIASLPDRPWVMTTGDVGRFLDLILGEQ